MDDYLTEGQQCSRDKTKWVTYQGILYILSLLTSVIFFMTARLLGSRSQLWFSVITAIVGPLQGLFNALVYFHPHYATDRQRCWRRTQRGRQQELENESQGNARLTSLCRVLDLNPPSMSSFRGLFCGWRRNTVKPSEPQKHSGMKEGNTVESV